jgi:probable phosphoglycerate mutase
MTILFLVRHGLTAHTGQTLYGRTRGIQLDDRGRAQARHLAERLVPVRPTAIYSSPLERCVQTVEPLAASCRLPIRERDGLIEMDVGSWTGRPLSRLRRSRAWREVQRSPAAFRFPGGGEGFAEARDRAVAEIGAIARRHPRGRVVVATHGDILRVIIGNVAGAPLDDFQRIVVDTASVSVVTFGRQGGSWVLLVNDTGGLERFAPGGGTPPWEAAGPDDGKRPRSNLRG